MGNDATALGSPARGAGDATTGNVHLGMASMPTRVAVSSERGRRHPGVTLGRGAQATALVSGRPSVAPPEACTIRWHMRLKISTWNGIRAYQ